MAIRYVVQPALLSTAQTAWIRKYNPDWTRNVEKQFFEFMDIPYKDIVEYTDSWKLVVSEATYKKLEVLASNSDHQETLFKIIEARYGK
jgi:hypothetical protein